MDCRRAFENSHCIDGSRIRLRPAVMADRWQIYCGLARSDLTDVLLGHPTRDSTPLLSYETFCDDYKEYYFDDSNPEGGRCFVIELDGQPVGQINYNDIERAKSRTELDIWMFGEEHCGRGYGPEALDLLCGYLHRRARVEGFCIKPSAANPRAIRAYEKAGFRRSALTEDQALREYGAKDSIDSVFMTRNIEQPHVSNSGLMRVVGGLRVGRSAPGDYSFYAGLFARMAKEVKNTGSVTRHVAFEYLADGDDPVTFLGIEVDSIENIPDGMIAWELSEDSLSVLQAEDGHHRIIWREDVVWQWRDESPSSCGRGVTGEFGVRVPGAWTALGEAAERTFSMTANAYLAPGQTGFDDGVRLVEYDPAWPEAFAKMSCWLRESLGPEVALDIHHFGSTSIPGMIAKPIVDVLVEVPSFEAAKQRALPLLNREDWEYWWYAGHMTFIKRDGLMGPRTHHVHMMPAGPKLQKRIAFRDYLRSHEEDASRYAVLKRQLAEDHQADRESYTDAKTSFVNEIVSMAMER